MIDDLDDGSELAVGRVVALDDNDATNLNEAPVRSLNQCFAHGAGFLLIEVLVLPRTDVKSLSKLTRRGRDRAYRSKLLYPFEVVGGMELLDPAGDDNFFGDRGQCGL